MTTLTRSRPTRSHVLFLGLIVAGYIVLGILYALLTPPWQTPDEPAHFNYVRHVVQSQSLPVLTEQDYDQAYLEEIKARKFPPDLPIDPIRYEGHQPPLYYLLVSPLLILVTPGDLSDQIHLIRIMGVLLGAGVIIMIWASSRRLFPEETDRALIAAGFAAFLPMHIAMMAAVNNDALAELMIAIGIFQLLGHLRASEPSPQAWAATGVVLGLGMLTKFQAYILIPLASAIWIWQAWQQRRQGQRMQRISLSGLAAVIPAFLIPLPWWIRNMRVYGLGDPLGLVRHDTIVVGQPRTIDWIHQYGLDAYVDRLIDFSFQSFWGVFGWLGVFMDSRLYSLLAFLALMVVVGLARQVWIWSRRSTQLGPYQRRGLVLLAMQILTVGLAFVWYNLEFVQHQGRYFFPALVAISIFFALGLESVLTGQGAWWGSITASVLAAGMVVVGLIRGDIAGWSLVLLLGIAAALALRARWHRLPTLGIAAALLLVMALIALQALFLAILPVLS